MATWLAFATLTLCLLQPTIGLDDQILTTETGLRFELIAGWFTEAKVRFELDTEPARERERRDVRYISPPLGFIEDRDHGEPATPADNAERGERMYRRQQLQTIIDLRNIS